MQWDPRQYARYSSERNRPFFDLLEQVRAAAPETVVDLGCGTGELTAALADRWPGAECWASIRRRNDRTLGGAGSRRADLPARSRRRSPGEPGWTY